MASGPPDAGPPDDDRRLGGWRPQPSKQGAAPGTLAPPPGAEAPLIRLIQYGPEEVLERTLADAAEIPALLGAKPVTWINVDGLADIALIRALGECFDLHRLALEDVVNIPQRPKVEEFPNALFVVIRMLTLGDVLRTEQVSLFVGEGYVLTFQERHEGDVFDPVRARIRSGKGRIRKAGPDYLAYALLDAVIDSYFPIAEDYAERLEDFEERILEGGTEETLSTLHDIKRQLLAVRRAVQPLQPGLDFLIKDEGTLVTEETRLYLRDCQDHVSQLTDLVQNYRDACGDLMDLQLSLSGHRTNEVMKVLTIMASIFIPLGFIAGLYGMN
ncbi:MAG: magnesium/cobalt transporter CorA, partial [Myxococcales bacterium]|nr:magnesium/cobalt transporter CorA [Myxococcales bacterium]